MKGLLKFITCGSVDDGKSTLIGHILYDSKLLYADQEKALELDSKVGSREGKIDYSLLLDGLMAEREQGITIDVAYRYFTTDNRSFIVADTPGHEEYTRNMAVGASFADLAVILVDAKQGVLIQTKRHARICALMGIKHFVFAVNKMDLVGYSEERFNEINAQIAELTKELSLADVVVIPVSATEGDNVTTKSENIPWYKGQALLPYLEQIDVDDTEEEKGFYMPVQRVCRPNHEFRGFQGQIEAGSVSVGDEIITLPTKEHVHVKSIHVGDKEAQTASIGQPVTIQLDREVDVSRGSVLAAGADLKLATEITATILWMDDDVLTNNKNFFVKLGTRLIPGVDFILAVGGGSVIDSSKAIGYGVANGGDVWDFYDRKRIIQKEPRRCLIMIAVMMVFWMLVRMCKFEIPYEMPTALRYAWYLYYIPMLLLPTVSLYLAFYIRQPENYKLPERRCLLFFPALFLIGIVLTNDLHQLVFTFPEGRLGEAASYEVGVYGYGAMYYAIVAWDLGCLLVALLIILLRCRKIKNRKMLWMPFGAYGLSVVYGIAYYLNLPFWKIFSSDMTAALCLLFALIIESCIQCGLILFNKGYAKLFEVCTI